jgi:hypothetical protein
LARSQSPFELEDFFDKRDADVKNLEEGYAFLKAETDHQLRVKQMEVETLRAELKKAQEECADSDQACYHLAEDKVRLLRELGQLKSHTVITDREECCIDLQVDLTAALVELTAVKQKLEDYEAELTAVKQKLEDYEAAKKPSAKKMPCTRCGATTTAQLGVCRTCKAADKAKETSKKVAEAAKKVAEKAARVEADANKAAEEAANRVRAKAAKKGMKRAQINSNRNTTLLGSDPAKKAKTNHSDRASVVSVKDMCQ